MRINKNSLVIGRVVSGSMKPLLKEGDMVLFKKTNKLSIGDVVGFSSSRKILYVHRVVRMWGNYVQTAPDVGRRLDVAVSRSDLEGKLISVKIEGKWYKYPKREMFKLINYLIACFTKAFIKYPHSYFLEPFRFYLAKVARNQLLNSSRSS